MAIHHLAQWNKQEQLAWLALRSLISLGAHLVLLEGDSGNPKKPIARDWQKVAPSLLQVESHVLAGNWNIGIVPASVDCLILDCDHGRLRDLLRQLRLAGRRYWVGRTASGKWHCWIRMAAAAGIGNRSWRCTGASGDVRHSKGQAKLHYLDRVPSLLSWLAATAGELASGWGDLGESVELIAPARAHGSSDYCSVRYQLGRDTYNATLKRKAEPTWAAHVAVLEGMPVDDARKVQAEGTAAAMAQMDDARRVVAERTDLRGRLADVLAAMIACAGGVAGECWASNATVGQVAGGVARPQVNRAIRELERKGYLAAASGGGMARRGKKTRRYRFLKAINPVIGSL